MSCHSVASGFTSITMYQKNVMSYQGIKPVIPDWTKNGKAVCAKRKKNEIYERALTPHVRRTVALSEGRHNVHVVLATELLLNID